MGKLVKSRYIIYTLCLGLIIFLYFFYQKKIHESSPKLFLKDIPFESVLQHVKITGITNKGYKWSLVANKIMVKKNFSEVLLIDPALNLIKHNVIIHINAVHGLYNKKKGKIELWEGVELKYSDINVKSQHLVYYIKDNLIKLIDGISARNTQVTIKGKEGVVDIEKNIFQVTNNVRVKII